MTEGLAPLRDGGRLSFRVRGQARGHDPVLLLRPLGGSMTLWGAFAEHLARDFEVIAFDPRGVGRSTDPPLLHSTRDMARDALELLESLGRPRAHAFGLSLGGMVATWLAIDAPESVHRLVLASTLPRSGLISHRAIRDASSYLRCLALPGVAAEVCLVRKILSPAFRAAHPDRLLEIERRVRANPTSRRNLYVLALAAARHDAQSALSRIRAQTLIVVGQWDPIAGRHAQDELICDIHRERFEVIPSAGHDVSLEQPEELARRVLRFFAQGHD